MSVQALLQDPAFGGQVRFGPGRRALPLRADYAGELTVEDLLAAAAGEVVQSAVPIKALRQSHHQLARVLAQGTSNEEASAITGYDPARISVLRSDPAFSELLAYYEAMEAEQYSVARADMHERLASLGFDSLEVLHLRVIEEPEKVDNKTLVAIVEAAADRTGFGKTSTVQHDVQHSLAPETIERIKAATASRTSVREDDRQALLRYAAARTASLISEEPAGKEGVIEGEGHLVREENDRDAEGTVASRPELPQVD